MNFDPKIKAWIMLITLVLATGGSVTISTYLAGAKLWVAILAGLVTGGSNVYHALSSAPNEPQPSKTQPNTP